MLYFCCGGQYAYNLGNVERMGNNMLKAYTWARINQKKAKELNIHALVKLTHDVDRKTDDFFEFTAYRPDTNEMVTILDTTDILLKKQPK